MILSPYLSSRPGSARTCGVWMDSRKIAPPSPSIRNACAPIVTSFRFTENKFRPVVSLMRNPAARHSNLSCPKNKWFSSKPFGSRVFIEKLREDSLKVVVKGIGKESNCKKRKTNRKQWNTWNFLCRFVKTNFFQYILMWLHMPMNIIIIIIVS